MFPLLFFLYVLCGLVLAYFSRIEMLDGTKKRAIFHIGFALLFAFSWPWIVTLIIYEWWENK